MKILFGVCEAMGIILLWSGCGYLTQKIRLLEETRQDLDMAIQRLRSDDFVYSVDDD